jgi:hypothetical protein
MGNAWKAGVCLVAIAAVAAGEAEAARRPKLQCANPAEVAAIQTTVVDQQLVDAALTCGDATREAFNTYRRNFGPELLKSDKLLLAMFKRIQGGGGDARYNLFKTDMASKAELRRVADSRAFCQAADLVLAAANAPAKPALGDFVAGVHVADAETPVQSCAIKVDVTLAGAQAAPPVVPRPRPPQPDDPPEVTMASNTPPAPSGVKVGSLTCNVSSGFGFIFGSEKSMKCTFATAGSSEHYTGTFSKYGVDIGYANSAVLVWGVVAPTSDMRPGSLEGDYAGAKAGASIGIGLGANVLIGGLDKSIALQPVSVQGNTGLNVAAGVGVISLKFAQ